MNSISVRSIFEDEPAMQLELVAGDDGLDRRITTTDVNRPGLALAGFYQNFAFDRIQVFGRGESAFLKDCEDDRMEAIRSTFFNFEFPALIFTHGSEPPVCFLTMAKQTQTPIFTTQLSTHDFILLYTHFIEEALAPETHNHGVLIEVFGIGILLTGASGIGKSETALELIERGHRLVADDIVKIKNYGGVLFGFSSDMLEHHMELRGIGIISVKDLFGIQAVRGKKRIELNIHLEDWNPAGDYERIGAEEQYIDILTSPLPRIVVPVRPGRNIPILIETAAINYRSKRMGRNAAKELSDKIREEIERKKGYRIKR